MATVVVTRPFACAQRTTTLASNTTHTFATITLYIPETASRTFLSARIRTYAKDTSTTAAPLSSFSLGLQLGAAAADFPVVPYTNAVFGAAAAAYVCERDVTSYFTANFGAGTSQTCAVSIKYTGPVTNNISAELIITYSFDDSAQTTRSNVAYIPIESNVANLTNTLSEIGTNQVPQLTSGGILPESSITIRAMFFRIWSNECENAITVTTDFQMGVSLDAEAEVLDGIHEAGAGSFATILGYYRIWSRDDMNPASAHAFKARYTPSLTNDRFTPLQVVLVVVYEYDHSASSTIFNSTMMSVPLDSSVEYDSSVAGGVNYRGQLSFYIEEPTTITLKQSGIYLRFSANNNQLQVGAGSQALRTYSFVGNHASNTVLTEGIGLIQRVDSGSAQGAGVTIARGKNTFTVNMNCVLLGGTGAISRMVTGMEAVLYLNYTSGKHANGSGVHNRTIRNTVLGAPISPVDYVTDIAATSALNSSGLSTYWINSLRAEGYSNQSYAANITEYMAMSTLHAEILSGESFGSGWRTVASSVAFYTNVHRCIRLVDSIAGFFKRFATDPLVTRLNPTAARKWRYVVSNSGCQTMDVDAVIHNIVFNIEGTVSGFSGAVTVVAHRLDTGEIIGSQAGVTGAFSIPWYDNTEQVWCEALESSTVFGRSLDGIAGTDAFDISPSSGAVLTITSVDRPNSTTLVLNLNVPIYNNEAIECLDIYSVFPTNPAQDARPFLRVYAASGGVNPTTSAITLTIDEMVQSADYQVDVDIVEIV